MTQSSEQSPSESKQASLNNEAGMNKINMINKADESAVNTINTINKPDKKTYTFSLAPDIHAAGKLFASQIGLNHSELVEQATVEFMKNHEAELKGRLVINVNWRPKQPGELNDVEKLELLILKQDMRSKLISVKRIRQRCPR